MNIFQKLLRTDLGEGRYKQLVEYVEKHMRPEVRENKELVDRIYQYCNCLDSEKIVGMQARLNETVYDAFVIGKTYMIAFFVYILAWCYVMGAGYPTEVMLGTIVALTVVFGLKTWQYFRNRCGYVDARILEAYRSVLDIILKKRLAASRRKED